MSHKTTVDVRANILVRCREEQSDSALDDQHETAHLCDRRRITVGLLMGFHDV